MSIFGSIASSVAGGFIGAIADPITKITGQIADTKVKLAQEENSERRIALEEKVIGLEAKRDVLVAQAQSGDTTPSLIQAVFATVAAVWFLKVVVFDTVLHAWTGWSTPELPSLAENVLMVVVGFYFVTVIAKKVLK